MPPAHARAVLQRSQRTKAETQGQWPARTRAASPTPFEANGGGPELNDGPRGPLSRHSPCACHHQSLGWILTLSLLSKRSVTVERHDTALNATGIIGTLDIHLQKTISYKSGIRVLTLGTSACQDAHVQKISKNYSRSWTCRSNAWENEVGRHRGEVGARGGHHAIVCRHPLFAIQRRRCGLVAPTRAHRLGCIAHRAY